MATDWYPDEEREIVQGFNIGFCYCDAAVAEGAAVKKGTSASGRVAVTTAAAVGDGIGVALKAGSAGSYIPVCTYGLIKMTCANATAITIGDFVMNSAESGVIGGAHVNAKGTSTNVKLFGGSSYVLGMALQTSTAISDEILVLVGKCI